MNIQVGRWDCRYCGHIGNLGPETKCSQCAAPRDPDVKFYLPEDAAYVTDAEELRRAELGADWNCDHCGADNKSGTEKCRACGNPRDESDAVREEKIYDLSDVPSSDKATRDLDKKTVLPETQKTPKTRSYKILYFLAAFIAVIVFLLYPRETTVEVSGHSWTRTIDIEAYRQVQEEDWTLPSQGEMIRSFSAIHHYDKILDHYESRTRSVRVKVGEERYACGKIDKGNGYFQTKYCSRPVYQNRQESYQEPVYRNDPVYRTKYVYNIYRWKLDRTNRASGSDKNPKWPEGAPPQNVQNDKWREGKKTEKYLLYVTDKKGKKHEMEVDFRIWNKYNVGDKMKAKTNLLGTISLPKE